jgi:hypothetical protein
MVVSAPDVGIGIPNCNAVKVLVTLVTVTFTYVALYRIYYSEFP